MFPPNAKFRVILFAVILFTEIVNGDLTMDTTLKTNICSRKLSKLIFVICSGNLPINDLPGGGLSPVRGKRAAIYFKERLKRQVVDECCKNACTVAQLMQYCPDTW